MDAIYDHNYAQTALNYYYAHKTSKLKQHIEPEGK